MSIATTVRTALGRANRLAGIVLHRPLGWKDFLLDTASLALKRTHIWGRPVNVGIEPLNVCDLKCDVCETGAGLMTRKRGMMSVENFRRFVDETKSYINNYYLYFMGESFLHPHIYEMIEYAGRNGIFVDSCTNGGRIDPHKVVDSQIDRISFQIGGVTEETHRVYRAGGVPLARIIENLREAIRYRNEKRLKKPYIQVGMIVMKHNEHEIDAFYRLAEEVGADDAELVIPSVRNVDQGRRYLPNDDRFWQYDRKAFEEQGILRARGGGRNSCPWIWYTAQICWNGDVVPCCRDPLGQHVMGNVFEEPLEVIWNNERFRAFRRRILTDQRNIEICAGCSSFGVPVMYRKEPAGVEVAEPSRRRALRLPFLRQPPLHLLPRAGAGEGVTAADALL